MDRSLLVVTGETSGDRYAARVLRELREIPGLESLSVWGSGGEAMRAEGAEVIEDVAGLSAIGPLEAARLMGNYWRLFRFLPREAERRGTRVALLVDFPDFNLRLAGALRRRGLTVLYYISPTVWVWRKGRIRTVRRHVDRMFCIFPFEEELYRKAGVTAEYVGHPMMESHGMVESPDGFAAHYGLEPGAAPVSVLPGSRLREIQLILPPVLEACALLKRRDPSLRFLVPEASAEVGQQVREILGSFESRGILAPGDVILAGGEAANVLANSRMGIIKSGTSTLQATVAGLPHVLVYRTSLLTYAIGRAVLSGRFIGMANLLAGREVVPELVQHHATPDRIAEAFWSIYGDPARMETMRRELESFRDLLGARSASRTVAGRLAEALAALRPRE